MRDPLGGAETVPSADAYSRFLKTLMQEQESIEAMFDGLLAPLKELLPDLGRHLAVERVNSRLDTSFHFEVHYIRSQKKMELRVGLAPLVMLALAVGHIQAGEKEKMRSLVQRPAA